MIVHNVNALSKITSGTGSFNVTFTIIYGSVLYMNNFISADILNLGLNHTHEGLKIEVTKSLGNFSRVVYMCMFSSRLAGMWRAKLSSQLETRA